MSKNNDRVTDSELESRYPQQHIVRLAKLGIWMLNNGFTLEETKLAALSIASHKTREILSEKFDEYLEQQRKKETFPYCKNDSCCWLLEKKYREDEMDKDHWYWCEVHGWIHGDQVKWLTQLQKQGDIFQ